MSPLAFVFMLIAAIIILTVLTLKFKMHPVMVLFITATFCGIASGKSLVDTFSSITSYFGSTLGSIGVMIIFGAVIAAGISDTGAATSMVNFFIRLFKGKRLELAPALTGFIMSIPVFGDIAIILNAPISAILAKRKKMSMTQVAPFVNLGLTLTHGLVPPTPGILAVSVLLGADRRPLGFVGAIRIMLCLEAYGSALVVSNAFFTFYGAIQEIPGIYLYAWLIGINFQGDAAYRRCQFGCHLG